MKGLIIFKGKYGATEQYANWLGEELGFPVLDSKLATANVIEKYDCIVVGGSVYVGKLMIRPWMKEYADILQKKQIFLFIVCATDPIEVQKLNALEVANNVPQLQSVTKTFFLQGRLAIAKLGWLDRLVLRIGARLEKNQQAKQRMVKDFDAVRKENLIPLLNCIRASQQDKNDHIYSATLQK